MHVYNNKCTQNFNEENLKGRVNVADLSVDWCIILKCY